MGCAIGCVKYLVFIFNLLFAILGLAIIVVGVLLKIGTHGEISTLSILSIVVIVVGVILFVIAFFGCCGAIRESKCMLITFAVFLITLLVIQIGICIYTFIEIKDEGELRKFFTDDFNKDMDKYSTNENIKSYINLIQKKNHCCGSEGPIDYTNRHLSIPASCCVNENCGSVESRYTDGCKDKIFDSIMASTKITAYVAVGIAIVELIGAIFALCLVNSLKNQYRRGTYA